MKFKLFIYILLLIPAVTSGNNLCSKAETTRDIADCLIGKNNLAINKMHKYLNAAKNKYKYDAELIKLISTSQVAWKKYQKEHCDAVYQNWSGGTYKANLSSAVFTIYNQGSYL